MKGGIIIIDLVEVAKETFKNKILITKNLKKNKIKIWYKNKKGRNPKPIILTRFLKLDKNFYEIIGMYFGDGLKSLSGSGNRQIYFANTEWNLHKAWVDFLNKFDISKNELHYQIQIGERNEKFDKDKIKKYWSDKLNLPLENFNKVSIKKNKRTKQNVVLLIAFYSKIYSLLFRNLYNWCLENKLKQTKNIVSFVKGLFAAEGSVRVTKTGVIHSVGISAGTHEKREFIRKLLKRLNIRSVNSSKRREVQITGYINFYFFKKLKLHITHPEKLERFNICFSKMKKNAPGLTKLRIINELKEGRSLTHYEIAKRLNRKPTGIHYGLKDLEKKGIISKRTVGFNCFWSLNRIPSNLFELTTQTYKWGTK